MILNTKETAQEIRLELKKAGINSRLISVRTDHYNNGTDYGVLCQIKIPKDDSKFLKCLIEIRIIIEKYLNIPQDEDSYCHFTICNKDGYVLF